MGNVAVIVHVVWSDGVEEWRPVRAIRWLAAGSGRHAVGEVVGSAGSRLIGPTCQVVMAR